MFTDIVGGREGVDHPKRAKTARCGCSRDGEGAENTKHAQTGVFRVFSERKVSKHVKHAHRGMPYVFGGMWEVEEGSWTRKTRRDGAFFVFGGRRRCGRRCGGVSRGGRVLTRRGGRVVVMLRGGGVEQG